MEQDLWCRFLGFKFSIIKQPTGVNLQLFQHKHTSKHCNRKVRSCRFFSMLRKAQWRELDTAQPKRNPRVSLLSLSHSHLSSHLSIISFLFSVSCRSFSLIWMESREQGCYTNTRQQLPPHPALTLEFLRKWLHPANNSCFSLPSINKCDISIKISHLHKHSVSVKSYSTQSIW